jgi:hypothetical protein
LHPGYGCGGASGKRVAQTGDGMPQNLCRKPEKTLQTLQEFADHARSRHQFAKLQSPLAKSKAAPSRQKGLRSGADLLPDVLHVHGCRAAHRHQVAPMPAQISARTFLNMGIRNADHAAFPRAG